MGPGGELSWSSSLLERTQELERIDSALSDAIAGEGHALLLEGPAGIGKTSLLEACRRRAAERGMTALVARGGELEGQFPYGVVRQLFEPVLRRVPPPTRAQLLSGAARLAAPVILADTDAALSPAADASGDAVFGSLHGLFWLTVNISLRKPALLAVDDLQWADAHSLRFLLYLARRLEGLSIAIVATARSGERSFEPDLSERLVDERAVRVIRPAALSGDGVARLLGAGLGRAPDREFAEACRSATGGIPFLVHELATALAADAVEPTANHAELVLRLGPRTVARATLAGLARMPTGCVPLVQSIAVLGGEAQIPRAAKLAGLTESDVLPALDALIRADVIRAEPQLEFAHPILRAAVYDELAPGERSRLHRRAAELLTADGAGLDAVAAQLLASEPMGSIEVIEVLREAAAVARARGAPESAVAYLGRALREGCDRELRAATAFELAVAARFADQWTVMVEQLEDARRLSQEPVLRSSAALELATVLMLRGEWDRPIALVEDALAELGDRSRELSVRLECLRAGAAAADPRRVADFDRRLPALRELVGRGGPPARSLALLLAAAAAWRGDDVPQVEALVERGWDGGGLLAAGVDRWTLYQGVVALVICEQLDHADELADALLTDARARGSVTGFHVAAEYHSWIDVRRGRLSPAESALRAAIEFQHQRRLSFELMASLWLATDVILERPEAADLAAIAEAAQLGPASEAHSGAQLFDLRGRLHHAAGRTEAGIADLRRAGEIWTALGFRNPNASSWRSALALMLGPAERDQARALIHQELDDARATGQPRAIGVALRALGLLEGGTAGHELLQQAATELERSPARLEYARALVELGAATRRAGERAAAREPLGKGLDLAAEAGATRLAERARTELAAAGARPRRVRRTGRDALTPSELRVARLAGEGRTNNEVAQALFVTPKTVDTHLAHVYAKLGISSRRELGEALRVRETE